MELKVIFSTFSDDTHVRNLVKHVKRENNKFRNKDVVARIYKEMEPNFNYESLVHVTLEMVGVEPESELYEALMVVHDDVADGSFKPRFDGLNMGEAENGARMYPKIHMIYHVEKSNQKSFIAEMMDAIGEGNDGNN